MQSKSTFELPCPTVFKGKNQFLIPFWQFSKGYQTGCQTGSNNTFLGSGTSMYGANYVDRSIALGTIFFGLAITVL